MDTPKKPRGRPSIKPKVVPIRGIVDKPIVDGNLIELVHSNPDLLKCLYKFYDKLKINNIFIGFDQNTIIFSGENDDRDVIIKTIINCKQVSQYFCEKPRYFRLGRQITQGAINCIASKIFPQFRICYNECGQLIIVLINTDLDSYREYDIKPLVVNSIMDFEYQLECYPLQFTLSDKIFSKYLKDSNVISDVIRIQKSEGKPLKFCCQDEYGNVTHSDVFRDKTKIALVENLGNEGLIHRSFKLSSLVKITGAVLAKTVTFYVNTTGPLLLKMDTDEATHSVIRVN